MTYQCFQRTFDDTCDYDTVLQDIKQINYFFAGLHSFLSDYLFAVVHAKPLQINRRIKRKLHKATPAINFNYTNTPELYTRNVFYVHGSLEEEEIVLGYDYRAEPCLIEYSLMKWSKILCRERLAFSRYLKSKHHIVLGSSIYSDCMQDIDLSIKVHCSPIRLSTF